MSGVMHLLLRHGQQTRSYLVRGAGARYPLLLHPSLSLVSATYGGSNNGELICASSSIWRRQCVSSSTSVEPAEAGIIEVWEEYFADPLLWWDNRDNKETLKSPDFKHKATHKSLWVGRSTPPWVKAMLKLVTESKLPSHVGDLSNSSQEIVQTNSLPKVDSERRTTLPRSVKKSKKSDRVGASKFQIRRAKSTSEAVAMLRHRVQLGKPIGSYLYVEVLKRCLNKEDLTAVKQVHACIIESGLQQNVYVANRLLSAYVKFGRFEDACRVFDELAEKDVFNWTKMIEGYAQHSRAQDAMEAFNRMQQEGVHPDPVTYLSILKTCASPSALKWGQEVHECIRRDGFESDVRVGTALMKMYADCGSVVEARHIFDNMASLDVISWNVMIGACAESGGREEAYRLFLQMKKKGFDPSSGSFVSLLKGCASAGTLEWVSKVHGIARGAGFESDVGVANALVHMYAKCGSLDDARLVFDRMEERGVDSWTGMIAAYAEKGCGKEAYRLFLQMIQEGFKPDVVTYTSLLNGCASAGALRWVKEVHHHARDGGLESDVRVGNALVHMYAKCGSFEDARRVFDGMEERDVVTWTLMIEGLAQLECGAEAVELFKRMIAAGVKPDGHAFVATLSACSQAGLLDEGRNLFLAMSQDYAIAPTVLHWNCMVDLLGRAGHLEEAKLLIDSMPVEPDGATWGALLSACESHDNLELAEVAATERAKLDQS